MKPPNQGSFPGPEQVIQRNIETMAQLKKSIERSKGREHTVVSQITRFIGSLRWVYIQLFLFAGWVFWNTGLIRGLKPFDPFPFPILVLFTSVEAIFFATFILISQNHLSEIDEKRENLNLQITLLTEHEVTRLIGIVDRLAVHLNMHEKESDTEALKESLVPADVLKVIEREVQKPESPP